MSIYNCLSRCIDKENTLSKDVKICMSDCQPEKYTAPLIWVGFYIAAASLVCMLAMGTDLVNGIRMKKSWFPCKFFTLNAAISAVLAIALKMPVDLSTSMPCGRDQLMKLSATALMSVSMGNFIPSLAGMTDPELFANLMALAVFIVPLISNVCIQIGTRVIYQGVAVQHIIIIFCIIIQFALLVSTAIACPTMKQQLDQAYNNEAKSSSSSEDIDIINNGKEYLTKHWIMAQTGSPQFVIARSVICTASGAICVLTLLVLTEAIIQLYITMSKEFMFFFPSSDYDWSATVIVLLQAAAVIVGSISPISRWFTVVWFKFETCTKSCSRDLWRVEPYWTKRLKDLREFQVGLNPRHVKSNIFIRNGKAMFLNNFIKFQNFTVVSCKFLCLISLVFLFPFMLIYKIIVTPKDPLDNQLSWVLKLEKEPDLPKSTLKKIISVVENRINKGTKKAISENQIKLLKKSDGFDGIKEFDKNLIEGLTKITIDGVSNNPNGRWAITIVTLSTIVCAIKTTWDNWDQEFVSTVNDILPHVIYVEKAVGASQANVEDAARNMWTDVLKYRKRLSDQIKRDVDVSLKMKLETLTKLGKNKEDSELAVTWMEETAKIVIKFLDTEKKKEEEEEEEEEEDKLCEQMTVMALDILVACLVKLGRAITANISNASIEKREMVLKKAVSIYGKTLEIQKIAKERFSSIVSSPDHQEYLHASWWKVVIPKTPLDYAIKSSTMTTKDHQIDIIESESISK